MSIQPLRANTLDQETGQYLTFALNGETYSIGIIGIKEIIEYGVITAVPLMPSFVRGIINLRGAVVPVFDLLARFGQGRTETARRTCVVIVEVQSEMETLDVGILVDAVNEVVDIPASDIAPPPAFGANIDTRLIAGMGKVNGQFVVILDIDRIAKGVDITRPVLTTDTENASSASEQLDSSRENEHG